MAYEHLLSPMNIGTMTVKNRTVMTAAEFSLGQPDGTPTEKLMDYYEERAKGGVGLIIPGVTRVNDVTGCATFTQLSMSHDYHIEPMREMARRIHSHGAKLGIQLHHAGRQAYGSSLYSLPLVLPVLKVWPGFYDILFSMAPGLMALEEKGISFSVQAPSDCELSCHGAARLHRMSKREIHALQMDFINAAERCKKADVDIVELHAGHGYLIQQFLSPHTNTRTDEYGGSLENRMRFLTEIVEGIRARLGRDYPLMVRLTADEMYDRVGKAGTGYDIEAGKEIAKRLETLGVDAINVTSAGYDAYNYWLEPTSFEPGWRAYVAKEIKSVVSIPVVAANFIRSPEQADRQIAEGYQDFMGSARTFICDPHWVKKIDEGHPEDIKRCIGCLNCIKSMMTSAAAGIPAKCALNPGIGQEKVYFNMPQDGAGRKVIVVGAGAAGLIAAETMARRGFSVSIYDKSAEPGGQIKTAAACNLKGKLMWAVEDLTTSVKKLGVELHLGEEVTAEFICAQHPYAVIVATGGVPVVPSSIRGADKANVCTPPEIIHRRTVVENKNVVVVGSGLTGLETAEILNETGNRVTVIEMADEIAPGAWFQLVNDEMERLVPAGTVFRPSTQLVRIEDESIVVFDKKKQAFEHMPADFVVLSLGIRPVNALMKELDGKGFKVIAAGDALRSGGTIADAVNSAYDECMKL